MILSMAVVMIPMHIRFVVCGELTIPHLGLIYYCFYKRKIAMRNLGRPSRSDFVQKALYFKKESYYMVHILMDGMEAAMKRIDDKAREEAVAAVCEGKT